MFCVIITRCAFERGREGEGRLTVGGWVGEEGGGG